MQFVIFSSICADYNYARFRDQTLRPHMCRIPVQNDIQVGSELDCLYLKDDSLLRQEENYNIFCEVFWFHNDLMKLLIKSRIWLEWNVLKSYELTLHILQSMSTDL